MDWYPYFKLVADQAVADQAKAAASAHWTVSTYAMRVGPGTDAVVWKLCDTNETVEL